MPPAAPGMMAPGMPGMMPGAQMVQMPPMQMLTDPWGVLGGLTSCIVKQKIDLLEVMTGFEEGISNRDLKALSAF
jgi:hypothetical protein